MKIRVDVMKKTAFVGGKPVRGLTYTELRVLSVLVGSHGATVSRPGLLRQAWGIETLISTRRVDMAVHRINAKMEAAVGRGAVRSVSGEGYRI